MGRARGCLLESRAVLLEFLAGEMPAAQDFRRLLLTETVYVGRAVIRTWESGVLDRVRGRLCLA